MLPQYLVYLSLSQNNILAWYVISNSCHSISTYAYIQTFHRPLSLNDWTRFDLYASRVKTFGKYYHHPNFYVTLGKLNPELIEFNLNMEGFHNLIMGSRHSVPLLPNLRELIINGRNLDILAYIGRFLGPHMSRIHIKYLWDGKFDHCIDPEHLESLFLNIGRSSPSLRCLQIGIPGRCLGIPESLDLGDAVSELVVNMHDLERFSCPWSLSENAIHHLATLPALKSLEIYHAALLDFTSVASNSDASFPVLENFTLATQSWALGIPWLKVIRSPLRSLQISVHDISETSEPLENLLEFLHSLHTTPQHDSLLTISLRDQSLSTYYPTHDHPKLSTSLTPLFKFNNLHAIDITFPSDLNDIDDTWIKTASHAWPHLQTLHIASNLYKMPTRPTITLRGLIPLITHCRSLSALTLSIDASDTAWISDSESFVFPPPNTELVEITSPMAVITDADSVFVCLSKMFARLEDFVVLFSLQTQTQTQTQTRTGTRTGTQTRSRDSWKDVSELLRLRARRVSDSVPI